MKDIVAIIPLELDQNNLDKNIKDLNGFPVLAYR